jgi:hypothetical protein
MVTIEHTLSGWLIGLVVVSGLLGAAISYSVWKWLHTHFSRLNTSLGWDLPVEQITTVTFFPILTGIFERIFFTILVAFQVTGTGSAAIAWIAVKMAVGWGKIKEGNTGNRALAFTGLLSSLTSMIFAIIGGLICNGAIPIHKLLTCTT